MLQSCRDEEDRECSECALCGEDVSDARRMEAQSAVLDGCGEDEGLEDGVGDVDEGEETVVYDCDDDAFGENGEDAWVVEPCWAGWWCVGQERC